MQQNYYDPFGNNNFNQQNQIQQQYMQNQAIIKRQKSDLRKIGFALGISIIGYLVFQVFAVSILTVLGLTKYYYSSAVFSYAFNAIGVSFFSVAIPFGIMSLIMKNHYTVPLIPTNKVPFWKGFCWVSVGMGWCIMANYIVSFIMQLVKTTGHELTQNDSLNPDSPFACVILVISVAIMPAICEEFAMRCCSLGLLQKYGKGFAVFIVSVVFGLLHGNVIQFLFAFLVGVILAFVTVKTQSILPAIFIHGLNNGMSALSQILTYGAGEKVSKIVVPMIYALWGILAILGVVVLAIKKEFNFNEFKDKEISPTKLSFGSKILAVLPGLVIPLIILVVTTIKTIK